MSLYRWFALSVVLSLSGCGREENAAAPTTTPAPAVSEDQALSPYADTVYLNGYVYTADALGTVAQAVALRGNQILYVGSNAQARAFVGEHTRIEGLDGRMMLPGLHDVHIHLLGLLEPVACDLQSEALDLDQIAARVKECLGQYKRTQGWLMVNQWNFAAGTQPTAQFATIRAALDSVSSGVPIFLRGNDGHHAAVNSAALARAATPAGSVVGLTRETLRRQFRGHRRFIGVDAAGNPDGNLSEAARLLVNPPDIWGFSQTDPKQTPEIAQLLAANGITSVQDAALAPELLGRFEDLAAAGRMNFRLTVALQPELRNYRNRRTGRVDIRRVMTDLRALRERFIAHPTIKATAAKIFIDGVMEGNPFTDPPTLPNAAVLNRYRQPQFTIDPATGIPALSGYVDLDSEVCRAARQELDRLLEPRRAGEFRKQHGFHPAQCELSHGQLEWDEDFIRGYMRALQEDRFVIHAHAIGDRAVRVAAANFAALIEEYGEHGLPHAIAHAQLIHPDDQRRIGAAGVYVAFTWAWAIGNPEYDVLVMPFISRLRDLDDMYSMRGYALRNLYPARGVREAGGILVAGSDAPVDARDPRPFVNMAAAVSRTGPDGHTLNAMQSISIHDVIAAYTRNGAQALQQATLTGSIEAGKRADLIILNQNIVELAERGEAARIAETRVLRTLFDGRIVYEAN